MIKKSILLSALILAGCKTIEAPPPPKVDDVSDSIQQSAREVAEEIKRINQIGANEKKVVVKKDTSVFSSSMVTINYIGSLEGLIKTFNNVGLSSRAIGTVPHQPYMVSVKASNTQLYKLIEDIAAQLPNDVAIKIREGVKGEIIVQYPQR